MNLLSQGVTQREISAQLGVSLCKVTRGAKILKNSKSVIVKCMIKEKNYANKFKGKNILVNLSGRGDKDVEFVLS
ncbi:MAG: Trp family transcriptional regulator [bacterium]|nr:Trp family transcriptional regulator [bacterium]